MSASITEYVDVNVTLVGAAADKFSFGTPLGAFAHAVTGNRQDGPYVSVAEVVAAGFTAAATPEINAWATAVFAQDDGVDEIIVGRIDAGDANLTASLNAIEAVDPESWYATNVESRVAAEIIELAAWTEARQKIAIAQTADADVLDGTVGAVSLALQAANYNRTALIYHATSTGTDGYLDGAWTSSGGGLQLDAPNGKGSWMYRQLSGVTYDDVSAAEAGEIFDANANLFGRQKGLNFTAKGTMASGRFIDVTTSLDWLKVRMEEEILSTFVGVPTEVPYTNGGINMIKAAAEAVFARGVLYGHLSPDEPAIITAPRVQDVASADKIARSLTLTGNCVLAGGIIKVVLNINVQQ